MADERAPVVGPTDGAACACNVGWCSLMCITHFTRPAIRVHLNHNDAIDSVANAPYNLYQPADHPNTRSRTQPCFLIHCLDTTPGLAGASIGPKRSGITHHSQTSRRPLHSSWKMERWAAVSTDMHACMCMCTCMAQAHVGYADVVSKHAGVCRSVQAPSMPHAFDMPSSIHKLPVVHRLTILSFLSYPAASVTCSFLGQPRLNSLASLIMQRVASPSRCISISTCSPIHPAPPHPAPPLQIRYWALSNETSFGVVRACECIRRV